MGLLWLWWYGCGGVVRVVSVWCCGCGDGVVVVVVVRLWLWCCGCYGGVVVMVWLWWPGGGCDAEIFPYKILP